MTPSKPTTAQDGQNSPKSINSMPWAELDLVAIEEEYNIEFFHSLPDGFKKTASHIGTIAALVATVKAQQAEIKRLRRLQKAAKHAVETCRLDYGFHAWQALANAVYTIEQEGYTCACCSQWQPDGVGHRCGDEGDVKGTGDN